MLERSRTYDEDDIFSVETTQTNIKLRARDIVQLADSIRELIYDINRSVDILTGESGVTHSCQVLINQLKKYDEDLILLNNIDLITMSAKDREDISDIMKKYKIRKS